MGGSCNVFLYSVWGFHPSGVAKGGFFLRKNSFGRGHVGIVAASVVDVDNVDDAAVVDAFGDVVNSLLIVVAPATTATATAPAAGDVERCCP